MKRTLRLELWEVGLDEFVQRDELRARPFCVLQQCLVAWCLMTSSECQVAVALEVFVALENVQLRAVFRVAAVKELREPLCLC